MTDVLTSLYNFLSNVAGTNQLLFVFLVSLFGNIIPIIPIPYLIIVITIVTTFPQVGIVQVAAVSALGAASGKFVSYGLGYGVHEAMAGSRARSAISLKRGRQKHGRRGAHQFAQSSGCF